MNKITISECVYNIHPIYNSYGANENDEILHICKNIKMKGNIKHNGYLKCVVKTFGRRQKTMFVHRFIWE